MCVWNKRLSIAVYGFLSSGLRELFSGGNITGCVCVFVFLRSIDRVFWVFF